MHCPQGVTYCTVVNWVIPGNTERHKRPHKSKENRNVLFFFWWSDTWFIKQYNLCSTNMFGIMLRLKWSSLRLNTRLAWSILWQSAKTVFVDYFLFIKKPEIKYAAKILFYAFSFVPRYLTYLLPPHLDKLPQHRFGRQLKAHLSKNTRILTISLQ